ncbi:uncharacterized protein LOC131051153 isoform X1 [Cryptomeria japonica]|uniref:uncharacterized protein LOC131051153 isoform X1 n=1 Tax=Cryptomeria japonica TaxID=3369 RepID=UPI0027D9F3DD|nr:uncharacterized protein LOC131051153 isoform X1 [Cryptomeria japonica]
MLSHSVHALPCARIDVRRGLKAYGASIHTNINLFEDHKFVRLLELPTSSNSASSFSQALAGGSFQNGTINAVVSPDIRTPFAFPFNLNMGITADIKNLADENGRHDNSTSKAVENYWQVRTVAAQMRMPSFLQDRMVNCAQQIHSTGQPGSLLLVSGGHPFRRHWPINCLFPNSFSLLRIAHELRNSGAIASGVQFWAVENPLVNSVDRLEKKIIAGAEAIIVQPPLLPERFKRWWDEANHRGLLDMTEVIVGIPLLTSARNFAFWLHLTEASGKEAEAQLQEFQKAEACQYVSGVMKSAFCKAWNLKTIEMVKSLPKVSGMHLMPITAQGWRYLEELVTEGKL